LLSEKYCPGIDPDKEIKRFIKEMTIIRVEVESVTGKEAVELLRKHERKLMSVQ